MKNISPFGSRRGTWRSGSRRSNKDRASSFLDRLTEPQIWAALAAFTLLVLLPGSESPSQITRGDVYRFVLRVAVGMVETGDYLLPRLGDSIDFSKPPLFHWILAGSLQIFKNPFFASRLPAILCSMGTVLLTYAFGRMLALPRDRSLLAALLWLVSGAMAAYGRQPLLEAPIALTILAALYGLSRACLTKNPAWFYLFGVSLGASSMIKWVFGPVTIGLFAVVYLAWSGTWRWALRQPAPLLGSLALAALIAVPWPAYVAFRHTDSFIGQMKSEIFQQRYKATTGILDFLGRGILIGLAPWTLLNLSGRLGGPPDPRGP